MVANASLWVKFFQSAGVPAGAAATYAHIFYENRMELDMLTDLNKEYLREMGILPMGDIIAILRHARKVHDQNMREKILSGGKLTSVASISVNPIVSSSVSSTNITLPSKKSGAEMQPQVKPARRVLPEHEGRYKITLPSGTTERSKEILAKKAMLYADKEKQGVFDRLQMSTSDTKPNRDTKVVVTGLPKVETSIFSRLGGKKEIDDIVEDNPAFFTGILKNSSKKIAKTIKKPATVKDQKVVLVKRIPAKAATMIADEYDMRTDSGPRIVSFSAEDEILEIESRRSVVRKKKIEEFDNKHVTSRLGVLKGKKDGLPLKTNSILHRTLKTVRLKPSHKRGDTLNLKVKTAAMKSDEIAAKKSIKSRLNLAKSNTKTDVRKIADRIGRVKLSSRIGNGDGPKKKTIPPSSTSVFDRLGFNK